MLYQNEASLCYFSSIMKPIIAVSGKDGQLGGELEKLSDQYPQYQFIFCNRHELDITNELQVEQFFQDHRPSFFINTAAYTAVDKAETEQEAAYKTNAEAIGLLALKCRQYDSVLITFSTDYVFNGNASQPYKEDQVTDPVNYYGYTKATGERLALENWEKTIIIRTSWVYSTHGNNFVRTMLRLMNERKDINVVNDQTGSPTFAKDLAEVVLKIISGDVHYGIYHFSNEGMISWFDFASEIKRITGSSCNIHPIPTAEFLTPAKRPLYSVLSKDKITSAFGIQLKDWKVSLGNCLAELLK
jgi:dTDP-4-dehydrorhamnose reductase